MRRDGRASANSAAGVHSRSIHEVQDHLHEPRADGAEKLRKGTAATLRRIAARAAQNVAGLDRRKSRAHEAQAKSCAQPRSLGTGSRSFWRRAARDVRRRRIYRTRHAAILLRSRHSGRERLRMHRSRHRNYGQRSEAVPCRHRGKAAARYGSENRHRRCRGNRRSAGAQQDSDVALSRRSGDDRRDDSRWLARDWRSGPHRSQRPLAALRPEEQT